jgi:hypothetical protein
MQNLSVKGLLVCLSVMSGQTCLAADIAGVWSDNSQKCNQVFVRKGSSVSFADDADIHGSGLIIDGNTIRGKMATCRITHRKADGDTLHLVASCATDIMLDTMQFSVRMIGDNKFVRIYPGVPELERRYERCAF